MFDWNEKLGDRKSLLLIFILTYVVSRYILIRYPLDNERALQFYLWLFLMVAPFVVCLGVYAILLTREGKTIARVTFPIAALGVLILFLIEQNRVTSWLERAQSQNAILSRFVVWSLLAGKGWLLPCAALLIFFSYLLVRWRRSRRGPNR